MEYWIWEIYLETIWKHLYVGFGGSGINVRKYDTTYLLAAWCWSGEFIFLCVHSKVLEIFFQYWSIFGTKHLQDRWTYTQLS